MNKSKVYQVSDEEFIEIIKSSLSYSECLVKLGLKTRGGSSTDILKRRIKELNCSIEHFKGKFTSSAKYELEEILVKDSTYNNISRLKQRLLNNNLLEYKCAKCGIKDGKTNLFHYNQII